MNFLSVCFNVENIPITIGLVFIVILFIFLGKRLKWQIKGILLLVLLILSSVLFGWVTNLNMFYLNDSPRSVDLKNASSAVGFRVMLPTYLPGDIKFIEASVDPPVFKHKEILINYSSNDHYTNDKYLSISESKSSDNQDVPYPPVQPDLKTENLKIKGRSVRLSSWGKGYKNKTLFLKINGIKITMNTNLSNELIVKVAGSLRRQ